MKEFTVTGYTIEEIKKEFPKVYSKIIDQFYHVNLYDNWEEFDFFTEILEKLGFYDIKFLYSGFGAQGDGLCFTGSYNKSYAVPYILKNYIGGSLLKSFENLQNNLSSIESMKITHYGRYFHSHSVDIDTYDIEIDTSFIRDFMNDLYRYLEKNYDSLTSIQSIESFLLDNEFYFNANGGIL